MVVALVAVTAMIQAHTAAMRHGRRIAGYGAYHQDSEDIQPQAYGGCAACWNARQTQPVAPAIEPEPCHCTNCLNLRSW